jgi:hypothetical protein
MKEVKPIICAGCGYEITEESNIFEPCKNGTERTYICPVLSCRYEGYDPDCEYIKNLEKKDGAK